MRIHHVVQNDPKVGYLPLIKKWTIQDLKEAVKTSSSLFQVAKKLGSDKGSYVTIIRKYIYQLDLDIGHWPPKNKAWLNNYTPVNSRYLTLDQFLCKDSLIKSSRVRRVVLRAGLLQNVCYKCGLSNIWMKEELTLQLHHINGDSKDNRIENLIILCPNCHSQTENYAGKSHRYDRK